MDKNCVRCIYESLISICLFTKIAVEFFQLFYWPRRQFFHSKFSNVVSRRCHQDFFIEIQGNITKYFRSPFNSKTLFGYLAAFSIQFITWFYLMLNCACVLSFLAGICWILMTFVDDIAKDLHDMKIIEANRITKKKKFYDIIEFHSNAKQLSKIN